MYRPQSPVLWAAQTDSAAILAIDTAASLEPFGLSHIQRYCEQTAAARALLYVAEAEPSGFVLFSMVVDEGSIDNIVVSPARQGEGIGGVLLSEALAAMRDFGMQRCLLDVRESNTPALALYHRYEFVEDGRRAGYYTTKDGREDAILMSRKL